MEIQRVRVLPCVGYRVPDLHGKVRVEKKMNLRVSEIQSVLSVFVEDKDVPESEFTEVSAADLRFLADELIPSISGDFWDEPYKLIGHKFVSYNKVRFDFRARIELADDVHISAACFRQTTEPVQVWFDVTFEGEASEIVARRVAHTELLGLITSDLWRFGYCTKRAYNCIRVHFVRKDVQAKP
jgi:hypothetical protein